MATDKKVIQKTAVKTDIPAVDSTIKEEKVVVDPVKEIPAPEMEKIEEAEKVEPVKVEEKSPMELQALKNGGIVDPMKEKTKEGLQSGNLEATVVVAPTTDKAELDRIAEVVRIAYEGKGSFSDDTPVDGLEQSLVGKSDEEIIETVKPYFIFTDSSQGEKATKLSLSDIPLCDHNYGKYLEEDNAKAKELMEAQNLNEIWRCADSGYWFSRQDYAEEYERKNKCSLQHYKK